MARPQKIGLDYFPFDVDFFSDRKIKVLFARFGCQGVAFYLYILCEIYRDKGFFVRCDEEFFEVASAELQIGRETLAELLDFMVERQLIHGELLRGAGVLTSRGIQARYQRAKENAGRKTPISVRGELWLLSPRETSACILAGGEEPAACRDGRGTGGRPLARENCRGGKPAADKGKNGAQKAAPGGSLAGAIPSERGAEGAVSPAPGGGLRQKAGDLPEQGGKPEGSGVSMGGEPPEAGNPPQGGPKGTASVEGGAEPASPDGKNPGEGESAAVELYFIEKQCISVENSGGKNPQRKGKKNKGEEKGGSAAGNRQENPPGEGRPPLCKAPFKDAGPEGGGRPGGDSIHWAVSLARQAFASLPGNAGEEIAGFLQSGAPPALIHYAVSEAKRLGKPYSYMAAIVRQRLAEGRLDVGGGKPPPSYDLEAFDRLGFHVPKFPKGGGTD